MAEGDKVVPSEGNPKLDPTRKNSGALNERLGITGRSLTNEGFISRSLTPSGWIRNNQGLLTHESRIEDNVAADYFRNRYSEDRHKLLSVDQLKARGEDERDLNREWLRGAKNRGSSQGDEQTQDDSKSSKGRTIYQMQGGSSGRGGFSIGTAMQSFSHMPSLKEMMEMPIVNVPLAGFGKPYCGPAIVGTMNFNGAAMQSNCQEAMTIANAINTEAKS